MRQPPGTRQEQRLHLVSNVCVRLFSVKVLLYHPDDSDACTALTIRRFGEARALVALAFARTNIGLMGIAADALIRASEVMRPCIQDKSCRSAAVWKLVGDIHTTAFKISPSCFGERAYRTLLGEASDSVPESSDTEANPTVWNRGHLALGRRLRGYAEAGAAAYSKLIAMAPEDYRPWADLGFNLLQQYRAARLASGVDSGHLSLQESRAAEADLAEAAARCFRQSARLSPKYDAAWVGIGLTDARPLVAQSALLRAAQLQSGGSNAVTISNAGMLYVELGRLALARRALVAAQSADPTNETMWIGHGLLNEVAAFHASTAGGQTTQEELEELQLRAWRRSAAAYLSAAELTYVGFRVVAITLPHSSFGNEAPICGTSNGWQRRWMAPYQPTLLALSVILVAERLIDPVSRPTRRWAVWS